jgi:general secretion pathway protein D
VLLEIEQEVSSVADSASSTSSDLGATFNTRTVNNAVLVGSGETVVVGGLLDKSVTDSADKVPLLGDIPVIGALFRSTSKKVSKRNLMLFIRPTIIRDRDGYRQASSGQYNAFNDAQTKQRGKDGTEASLNDDLLHIYPQQDTAAFRRIGAAIDAFNLGGQP